MISNLAVSGFKAVPYLETSALMVGHRGKLAFSQKKVNVLVGRNGTGKSALIHALTIRFLATFTGESRFDPKFVATLGDAETWWAEGPGWARQWQFLPGLSCETDNAPAVFYRPGHIPGNETGITHAMMTGYSKEARAYAGMVERKSTGQGNQARLERLLNVLAGRDLPSDYENRADPYFNPPARPVGQFVGEQEHRAAALGALVRPVAGAKPLILMDEPEQSLDALAQAQLWAAIAAAPTDRVQVIVATHSLHPLLHRERFNLIETETGFVDEVLQATRAA